MHSDSEVLLAGLDAIAATYSELSRRFIELGADGIFYASKWVGASMMSRADHERFAAPFDRQILRATEGAPFNIVHLCGEQLDLEVYRDYPAAAVNWALCAGNPTLAQARSQTSLALLGGVSAKPDFARLTPKQIKAQVRDALDATNGRHFLLGPGCSVNPGSPPANYRAARDAATVPRE